jgi:hypothetical protein
MPICQSFDDRYLGDYVTRSFMSALLHYRQSDGTELASEKEHVMHFKSAGLVTFSKKAYGVLGLSKGGVIKLLADDKTFSDCGYRISQPGNKQLVSSWSSSHSGDGKRFTSTGQFMQSKFRVSNSIDHGLLRIAAFFFRKRLIGMLKRAFILDAKKSNIKFERNIEIKGDKLLVVDKISSDEPIKLMTGTRHYSMRYVPSSKFFVAGEIQKEKEISVRDFMRCEIRREISLGNLEEKITIEST